MDTTEKLAVLKGGEFLVKESTPDTTFIPEEMTEDQLMIRQTVRDFVQNEVLPNAIKIDKQEDNIAPKLLEKAAELGLLSAHMPEEYGGMNLDTNTNTIIAEEMGWSGSFTVTFAAHIGIGMLPILYFGTDEQKMQYLPRLANGELKASYCLTEPGSGSDALAAKTRADLSADGKHYILNGQKMWISNAGFADVLIVFAKVDGDKFTGFIVDRNTPGISFGPEEDKLGIKGSSTRQVFFENAHVPVENLLGAIGKGHLIAFNVLNIGRFKLGALVLGSSKQSINLSVNYANERQQFGTSIANFGAIQYKLGEQAIRAFVLETAQYRVSNLIHEKIQANKALGEAIAEAKLDAAEEYAIECAMMKVYGSEVLDYCVDETVQIHGGNGFSEEYKAAKAYRDARINRIYEGTNEINRLLSVDMLMKRALKGHINITDAAWGVQKELASMPSMTKTEGPYGVEADTLKDLKKCILMVAGAGVKAQMDGSVNLKDEQEVLMNIADMMIHIFNLESLLLRVQKLTKLKSAEEMEVYNAILRVYTNDTVANIQKWAQDALCSFAVGDVLDIMLRGVKRFCKYKPVNVKNDRRLVAQTIIKANSYNL
jgi:alkylation response protein AidB-like acyl-CoA dehydrogenase